MFTQQTYIVRVYRQESSRGPRFAGIVEMVQEQRSVPFAGLPALVAILRGSGGRGHGGIGRSNNRSSRGPT